MDEQVLGLGWVRSNEYTRAGWEDKNGGSRADGIGSDHTF